MDSSFVLGDHEKKIYTVQEKKFYIVFLQCD